MSYSRDVLFPPGSDRQRKSLEVRFVPIVLKNSFLPMIENSQSRWRASLALMRGNTSITAKTPADARIGFTEPCIG